MFATLKISKRHVAKSLSWRFIGSLDTLLFAWLVTGNFSDGLNVSLVTTITKLVWYYIHEQLWFKSSMADSNKRHIIKTFSWRFVGTIDTVVFAWLLTGNPLTLVLKLVFLKQFQKCYCILGMKNYGIKLILVWIKESKLED